MILDLDVSHDAPAQAREAVRRLGAGRDRLDVLELLVSELVTNAILHSGAVKSDLIRLSAEAWDEHVRISVCDPGVVPFKTSSPRSPEREGGWGLSLVEQLADEWGIDRDTRTCVWFELTG